MEGSSYSGKGGIFCVQVDGPITEGLMSWEWGDLFTVSGSLRYPCAAVRMCSSAWYAFCLSVSVTALEQGIKINMSLWSRDDPSRETLFIYLQDLKIEITGQIFSAKGLEIHLLLVCNSSRILEKPISKSTEMGATSASGKSAVMRVFSSHQQQHLNLN